ETSNQAGRFWGRAKARVLFTSILTPDFCEYPIDGKLIEAKNNQVHDEVIVGRGHAKRDVLALLFPPTTVYQLLRLPSRGPKLTLDEEVQLTIKIMQPLYQAFAEGGTSVSDHSRQEYLSAPVTSATMNIPSICSKISRGFLALPRWFRIQRSF